MSFSRAHMQGGFIEMFLLLGAFLAGTGGVALFINHEITQPVAGISVEATPQTTPALPSSVPSTPQQERKNETEIIKATIQRINSDYSLLVTTDNGPETVKLFGLLPPSQEHLDTLATCSMKPPIETYKNLMTGVPVFLVADAIQPDRDAENKLLRYAFLDDATFINKEFVRAGVTQVDAQTPMYIYKDEFLQDEEVAKKTNAGIWSVDCTSGTPVPMVSITPTKKPTMTPTPTVIKLSPTVGHPVPISATRTPTTIPPSLPPPSPTITFPTSQPSPSGSLNSELIFALINAHRKNKGLPAFEKDEKLCSIAASRGPELYNEIFVTKNVHAGLYNRNLPWWITENMAHYPTEEKIVNWWLGSTIHRNAIEGTYTYSCGVCFGNSCAQLFTSWVEK